MAKRVLGVVAILAAGALGLYLIHLDRIVLDQFEGKRWAVPARVYARPMELYEGRSLTADQFAAHLAALGYRNTSGPAGMESSSGTYSRRGATFDVAVRGFRFWDAEEPARLVTVSFAAGSVSELRVRRGPTTSLLRFDPAVIAGIYPAHKEDRVLMRVEDLPEALVQALIAVEDQHFYQHFGVDPKAVLRALVANLKAGRTVQGGSTLTQQLVKNFFLTRERTLARKLKEMLMALLVEWRYDKDEILEAYCNEVYLGQDGERAIHGFGLASHFFFGRPLSELEVEQLALLVGLVKGPSVYNPRRHPERAKRRRDLVLRLMAEQGYVAEERANDAARRALEITPHKRGGTSRYPTFVDLVRRQLLREYREEDLTSEGLQVFTTLDLRVQTSAERALAGGLPILERRRGLEAGTLEGAAVFSDPQTGEVLALVGGRRVRLAGFNRALDGRRQIGSLVKPFVYLLALSDPTRFSLLTPLQDEPLRVRDRGGVAWSPENYDRRYHGLVALKDALAHSYNAATARLGLELGMQTVIEGLDRYGVKRSMEPYPSLLLGALELTPFEVTELYQVLANGGFRTPLRAIREVVAADGSPLRRYPLTVEQVAPSGPVYLLTLALQEVVSRGTGRSLLEKVPSDWALAGKTGTSSKLRDSWFAGFSGDLLGVVWLGRDDDRPAGLSGAGGALRIFGDAVRPLGLTPLRPVPPSDVETLWVSSAGGLQTNPACPGAHRVPFMRGYGPDVSSSCGRGRGFVSTTPTQVTRRRREGGCMGLAAQTASVTGHAAGSAGDASARSRRRRMLQARATGAIMLTGLLIVGCAGTQEQPGRLPPVEDRSGTRARPSSEPSRPAVQVGRLETERELVPMPDPGDTERFTGPAAGAGQTPQAPEPSAKPAVLALVNDAGQHLNNGDLDRAAAALERAIRIEPSNAGIWYDLAQVRFQQRQLEQAETLAARSRSLAGQDRSLQALTWRLTARARAARGDGRGAQEAEAQAVVLERPR